MALALALSLLRCAAATVATSLPSSSLALSFPPAYTVHAFYYLWYGNPQHDGQYKHWDHAVLPHYLLHVAERFPSGQKHQPPGSLHSPYYPQRGPYSSGDEATIKSHVKEMLEAGIGVMVSKYCPYIKVSVVQSALQPL